MVLIELFIAFLKIGFASFGGSSMVPLINAEMLAHGWMSTSEVVDIVAIAEMTPGPLGTNCATFAGTRVAGVLGAVAANLGVLMPTLTLTLTVAFFLEGFKENRHMGSALRGIRPASIGVILMAVITIVMQNYSSWQSCVIGVVSVLALCKLKLSVPAVVVISAALGIIIVR